MTKLPAIIEGSRHDKLIHLCMYYQFLTKHYYNRPLVMIDHISVL